MFLLSRIFAILVRSTSPFGLPAAPWQSKQYARRIGTTSLNATGLMSGGFGGSLGLGSGSFGFGSGSFTTGFGSGSLGLGSGSLGFGSGGAGVGPGEGGTTTGGFGAGLSAGFSPASFVFASATSTGFGLCAPAQMPKANPTSAISA
jgi:hypothetical protein